MAGTIYYVTPHSSYMKRLGGLIKDQRKLLSLSQEAFMGKINAVLVQRNEKEYNTTYLIQTEAGMLYPSNLFLEVIADITGVDSIFDNWKRIPLGNIKEMLEVVPPGELEFLLKRVVVPYQHLIENTK